MKLKHSFVLAGIMVFGSMFFVALSLAAGAYGTITEHRQVSRIEEIR